MAIEIERRFLVNSTDWKPFSNSASNFHQGYLLSNQNKWAIRVRIINEVKSLLTLKSSASKLTNHEFEYEIPLEDGKSLMMLCEYKISKPRHQLNIDNTEWVVDCFHEKNSPLILAEIELNSPLKD